jgi:soluble lytic murein transglycosylase-like protein
MKRGAGVALFLLVTLSSVPSVPSVPEVSPPRPSPAEIAQLEALSQWVAGDRSFHAIAAGDRERALQPTAPAVALFGPSDGDASRRLLARLPYGAAISSAAERHRVDGLLLAALVEVESSFDPRSRSQRGAMGLMQIMPVVASGVEDPFDPTTNLDLGARYFSRLLRRFGGDVELALAAYNAGPGAVERFGGMPPYRETNRFVSRVMRIYADHSRGAAAAPGAPSVEHAVLAAR